MITRIFDPRENGITDAATVLSAGGLIAFPTETVYGLGADAHNGLAVARVYEAKGRPSFNPLIVHVANLELANRFAHFNDLALDLAATFWPGPLSLVVPLRPDHGLGPADPYRGRARYVHDFRHGCHALGEYSDHADLRPDGDARL